MSYVLVPKNSSIQSFKANNHVFLTLLNAARDLHHEEFHNVIILPPENHSGNYENIIQQGHGWTLNDGQRTEPDSAANLGRALAISARLPETRELLLNLWNASTGQLDSPETQQENAAKLQRKLAEFAAFLQASQGFEIR